MGRKISGTEEIPIEIILNHATITYPDGGKTLVYNQILSLDGVCALTSPSGSGKTTLLHLLAGLISPTKGEITGHSPKKTGLLFQENRLFPWRTVGQHISDVAPKAQGYLELVGLQDEKDRYPDTLSGGMCRRLAIARLLAYGERIDASLYLLDEPFTGLDEGWINPLLDHLKDKNTPTLIATHQVAVTSKIATQIIF